MPRTVIALLASTLLVAGVAEAQRSATQTRPPREPAAATSHFLGGFLKRTSIVYPLAVGDWQAQGEHIFELQEAGVSVAFRNGKHADQAITVYFYPAGVAGNDVAKQAAEASIADIKGNIGIPGGYEDVDMAPLHAVSFDAATSAVRGKKQGWGLDMRLQREGRTYHSAMMLLVDRLYFVKGRLSLDGKAMSRAETSHALQDFLGALLDSTRIGSTGNCWDPLRQVEKSSALDGSGMSIANRFLPGCEPPSDVLQSVPQGMREIHLEYRAPGEHESGPPKPLRTKRSGVG